MAKEVRLTKKEVLEMFDQVDFREHFKGTGKSEAEIKGRNPWKTLTFGGFADIILKLYAQGNLLGKMAHLVVNKHD